MLTPVIVLFIDTEKVVFFPPIYFLQFICEIKYFFPRQQPFLKN